MTANKLKSAAKSVGNGLLTTATVLHNSGIQTEINEIDDRMRELQTEMEELSSRRSDLEERKLSRY